MCDALLILPQTLRISYATNFNKEALHSELICKTVFISYEYVTMDLTPGEYIKTSFDMNQK